MCEVLVILMFRAPGEVGTQNVVVLLGVTGTLLNGNNNKNFKKAASMRLQGSQSSQGKLPAWISQENKSLIHQPHLTDKKIRNSNIHI